MIKMFKTNITRQVVNVFVLERKIYSQQQPLPHLYLSLYAYFTDWWILSIFFTLTTWKTIGTYEYKYTDENGCTFCTFYDNCSEIHIPIFISPYMSMFNEAFFCTNTPQHSWYTTNRETVYCTSKLCFFWAKQIGFDSSHDATWSSVLTHLVVVDIFEISRQPIGSRLNGLLKSLQIKRDQDKAAVKVDAKDCDIPNHYIGSQFFTPNVPSVWTFFTIECWVHFYFWYYFKLT